MSDEDWNLNLHTAVTSSPFINDSDAIPSAKATCDTSGLNLIKLKMAENEQGFLP